MPASAQIAVADHRPSANSPNAAVASAAQRRADRAARAAHRCGRSASRAPARRACSRTHRRRPSARPARRSDPQSGMRCCGHDRRHDDVRQQVADLARASRRRARGRSAAWVFRHVAVRRSRASPQAAEFGESGRPREGGDEAVTRRPWDDEERKWRTAPSSAGADRALAIMAFMNATFCPYFVLEIVSGMTYVCPVLLAEGHRPVMRLMEQDAAPARPVSSAGRPGAWGLRSTGTMTRARGAR